MFMLSRTICTCGKFKYCEPLQCKGRPQPKKRGATDRRIGRFGRLEPILLDENHVDSAILQTDVKPIMAKSIISTNQSPDIPWSKTVNPYIGCEHGCIYCYARPTHAYYDLSPGLDFESKLFVKTNADELLRAELSKPAYRPTVIGLGTNTDAYQPIERKFEVTRRLLQVLEAFRHPVSVLTKNSLIERDIDILQRLAKNNLVEVHFTLTSLQHELSRMLEPRASLPKARLDTIKRLSEAGIPVKVMFSPVIPGINDHEMEAVMTAARTAGATCMGYILIRLPHEVRGLFSDWLEQHMPHLKNDVITRIDECRADFNKQFSFETRMAGEGLLASQLLSRFQLCFQQFGFRDISPEDLDHSLFTRRFGSPQLELF
jgi:DNA repair photolyase